MANTNSAKGFKAIRHYFGAAGLPTEWGTLNTSVTVAIGDALTFTTTGFITLGLAASTTILGVSKSAITGAAGVTPQVAYTPNVPGIIWQGQCSTTGTRTICFETHDMSGGTGAMQINDGATSTNVIFPLKLATDSLFPENAFGQYAKFEFVFTKSLTGN
jgi:hypothetical protein